MNLLWRTTSAKIYTFQIQNYSYVLKLSLSLDRYDEFLKEASIGMFLSHHFPQLFVKHYGIGQLNDKRIFILQEKCGDDLLEFYKRSRGAYCFFLFTFYQERENVQSG